MDNHVDPIVIEDDSSNIHILNPLEDDDEEEEEEAQMDMDDKVICIGEVCFDKNGNLVKQHGNFCLHYPNYLIHKSPYCQGLSLDYYYINVFIFCALVNICVYVSYKCVLQHHI